MLEYVETQRSSKIKSTFDAAVEKARLSVSDIATGLFEDMPLDLWPSLRDLIDAESKSALAAIQNQLQARIS